MKKIVCILAMALMLLTFTQTPEPVYAGSRTDASREQYLASDICDENLTWTLDDAGVLPYSIGTYCESIISNGTAAQRTLAETAAVYGSCARDNFAG